MNVLHDNIMPGQNRQMEIWVKVGQNLLIMLNGGIMLRGRNMLRGRSMFRGNNMLIGRVGALLQDDTCFAVMEVRFEVHGYVIP